MVDSAGHAKLVDFGFAKKLTKNRTNTMCGTPGYLAPEQINGSAYYGIEIDLWAFGVLVFELFAGYNPFDGGNSSPPETYQNIKRGHVSWPPYINKVAKDFIKKVLVVEPSERLTAKRFCQDPLFAVRLLELSIIIIMNAIL